MLENGMYGISEVNDDGEDMFKLALYFEVKDANMFMGEKVYVSVGLSFKEFESLYEIIKSPEKTIDYFKSSLSEQFNVGKENICLISQLKHYEEAALEYDEEESEEE